jgi:hypothetical protein
MDIAGLSKLTADTLVMVVAVLGFLVGTTSDPSILVTYTCLSRSLASVPKNLRYVRHDSTILG